MHNSIKESKNKLLVITGPTATGKSALAVDIARRFNGEIISADSRQVYKGLDIGSAKITPSEMQEIPHHLIDVVHPTTIFTVAEFKQRADKIIADITSRGKLPILVGGTGMYISAVVDNQEFPEVPPNQGLRTELEQFSTEKLFEKLKEVDPIRATSIDRHNRIRIIRALEIVTVLGRVPTTPRTRDACVDPTLTKESAPYNVLMIGLRIPKEELDRRIEQRIHSRIPALFDEIRKLHAEDVSSERLRQLGLEYRYGDEYVTGKILLAEFIITLTIKTIQFAKRQMTWFKRDTRIHWLNPESDRNKIIDLISSFTRQFTQQ